VRWIMHSNGCGHDGFLAYADKLAAAIPNAERVWIKDAGHWLIEEKPDEVGAHLNKFLS